VVKGERNIYIYILGVSKKTEKPIKPKKPKKITEKTEQ
jgi:hypothetical protein